MLVEGASDTLGDLKLGWFVGGTQCTEHGRADPEGFKIRERAARLGDERERGLKREIAEFVRRSPLH